MRKYWPALLVSSLIASTAVAQGATQAGAAAPMAEAAVGTAVAERALQGAAESFAAGTERVYCFARITNVPVDGEIEFVWYKGETEVARVKQTVRSSPYRTWSSKTLGADGNGDWRCDVVNGDKVLQSIKFKVG
jgi:hypothetical protein